MVKVRGPQMGGQIRRGRIWRFWGAPIFSPEVPPKKSGEFQVTVCGVTVCPFPRHKGNQRPKCLLNQAQMHLSRNCPFSNKTNLHLELPGTDLTPICGPLIRRLSENVSVAYLYHHGETPSRHMQAEQYSDTVLCSVQADQHRVTELGSQYT